MKIISVWFPNFTLQANNSSALTIHPLLSWRNCDRTRKSSKLHCGLPKRGTTVLTVMYIMMNLKRNIKGKKVKEKLNKACYKLQNIILVLFNKVTFQ